MRMTSLGIIAFISSALSGAGVGAQRVDTTVIRVGAPLHAGAATLVADLKLGEGSAADEYTFTYPFLFPSHDGGLFIVDIVDPSMVGDFHSVVRRYDRSGKFVRNYGRIGDGPGEFRGAIGHVAELPDGRVLLTDRHGILVYARSGQFIEQWKARAVSTNMGNRLFVDPRGFVQLQEMRKFEGATNTSMGPPTWSTQEFSFDGKSSRRFTLSPNNSFAGAPKVGAYRLPFSADYIVAWSPLGYWVTASTGSYDLELHTDVYSRATSSDAPATRDRIVRLRRSVPPVSIAAGERAAWRDHIIAQNRARRETPTWTWNGPDIPASKPPIVDVQVAMDGRIWVQAAQPSARTAGTVLSEVESPTPASTWFAPVQFDVLGADGRYFGSVRFPDSLYRPPRSRSETAFIANGDVVWATTLSADGEPIVRRYHVAWSR
jgi:hypothetical protein